MLSESQERMLLVADKGREGEVLAVFEKWGLDASIVGIVTADDTMRVTHHGELVAEIPNKALTADAPVYKRPVGEWSAPLPMDAPAEVLTALRARRDWTADLKTLLASANICSKAWVFEQYDSMVQTNTVQGPGGEAGVMRIKGTGPRAKGSGERGIAMALAGNGRWAYLDPKLGASHAVAEAARKVACTGAVPVSATNCLNFGNPEKPEIMAQLSAAIDGIAEACVALGTPVTGGNVSLYNETRGEGIYPTPVLGIVGLIEDVSKAVPAGFQRVGDKVLLLQSNLETQGNEEQEFGSSDYAKTISGAVWGVPPWLDLKSEAALHKVLAKLSERGLIASAKDVSDGGLAVALAEGCFAKNVGVHVNLGVVGDAKVHTALFAENATEVLISCAPELYGEICFVLDEDDSFTALDIGETIEGDVEIWAGAELLVEESVRELKKVWAGSLEAQLATEVTA